MAPGLPWRPRSPRAPTTPSVAWHHVPHGSPAAPRGAALRSVLLEAGMPTGGLPCWKLRITSEPEADATDATEPTGAADSAAATPCEESAREGLSSPSPRVHGAGGSAYLAGGGAQSVRLPPLSRHTGLSHRSAGRPHDPGYCGAHPRRVVSPLGRPLLVCPNGGYGISTHDSLAAALASLAPPRPLGAWPGANRFATAVKHVIKRRLASLAPGREWRAPDVAAPGDTFVDITVSHITPSRLRGARDGRSCVLYALYLEETMKRSHYKNEMAPSGPLAPGTGCFVPFAVASGGLLGPAARQLLRRWAKRQAGPNSQASTDGPDGGGSESQAATRSFLAHGIRLLSTVLHRWNACHVHAAASELAELHVLEPARDPSSGGPNAGAPSFGGSAAPASGSHSHFGNDIAELLSSLPQELELADIDSVGLESTVTLLA